MARNDGKKPQASLKEKRRLKKEKKKQEKGVSS